LPPYYKNIKKRILKSPKIYLRDSGLLHTLLGIPDFNNLLGHPSLGQSWEAFALENILSELNDWKGYYFRTSNGAEIDLILEKGLEKIAIEFKASTSPKIKPGSFANLEMLGIKDLWIVAPIEGMYELKKSIHVTGLIEFINTMKKYYH
jgi:predicted AAA+ superfamily ATPase